MTKFGVLTIFETGEVTVRDKDTLKIARMYLDYVEKLLEENKQVE